MGRLFFLGPEGTFTHQAALNLGRPDLELAPLDSIDEVYARLADSPADRGLVPVENSVEGYILPTLDGLLGGRVAAVGECFVPVTFDAMRLRGSDIAATVAVSHPHALAQCREFIRTAGLSTRTAESTAAACRDLQPGELAIAAPLCAGLYDLERTAHGVEDFRGTSTRFLVLATRSEARQLFAESTDRTHYRTMYAITPQVVGPGVLTRVLVAFGDRRINLTSLITRPLKGQEGRYTFVLTAEVHPHSPDAMSLATELMRAGDYVLTLGAFPSPPRPQPLPSSVDAPQSAVTFDSPAERLEDALLWP